MPIEVDEAKRLDEIATATIQVARDRGVRSVTIRAVAEQLGGSTAMVTNYVANRAALMINALRRAEADWSRELERAIEGVEGEERLRAAVRWMCTTEQDDEVLRRLMMEIASAGPGAEVGDARRSAARSDYQGLTEMVAEAGLPDAELSGDVLHLVLRGYWLATLEDPESWSAERGERAILAVVDKLRGSAG
ncbi:TetR/AcrR family transcriptional regulator [Streptomyces sp. NBC_00006]|uniref:TetR/AcrR family transcriptional regulator n=1 Tax=unclassified Streptomyces TaxID=2593676 RepID=UPI00225AAE5B|nr:MULTISPECIES: TetR/AcrR family transcriptional regulator [unclassified Streptomyces]MCX4829964.1 TetR/AcrR family transcriptional regulator [Streptomyces sp. NBC_01016]MCX5530706.1 TetR/AcrR family transcriptional regulator [Streptomyces sp. NBC_00006]